MDALGDAVWSESWLLDEVDRMESLIEEELGPLTPFDPIDEDREFVENQRGLLEGAEVDVDTFRAPFCLQEFGSLDASFETTWGSSNGGFDGIWDAGDLDLTVISVLSGGAVTFDEFEAAPGATLSGTLTTSLYGWAEVD